MRDMNKEQGIHQNERKTINRRKMINIGKEWTKEKRQEARRQEIQCCHEHVEPQRERELFWSGGLGYTGVPLAVLVWHSPLVLSPDLHSPLALSPDLLSPLALPPDLHSSLTLPLPLCD